MSNEEKPRATHKALTASGTAMVYDASDLKRVLHLMCSVSCSRQILMLSKQPLRLLLAKVLRLPAGKVHTDQTEWHRSFHLL